MTRDQIIESFPDVPVVPIVMLCADEDAVVQVEEAIDNLLGTRYRDKYDVRVVVNTDESQTMILDGLCLAYIDSSVMDQIKQVLGMQPR